VVVVAASGFPDIARTGAAAVPDAAFIGMGVALLSRRLKTRAGPEPGAVRRLECGP
jgi:hypothetical protein